MQTAHGITTAQMKAVVLPPHTLLARRLYRRITESTGMPGMMVVIFQIYEVYCVMMGYSYVF